MNLPPISISWLRHRSKFKLHQKLPFWSKMYQNRKRVGLRPRPHWGSLQRSPRPPSCKRGRGGQGRAGEGRSGRTGKGRGGDLRFCPSTSTSWQCHWWCFHAKPKLCILSKCTTIVGSWSFSPDLTGSLQRSQSGPRPVSAYSWIRHGELKRHIFASTLHQIARFQVRIF